MQDNRDNQQLARLIYTLFAELGITQTSRELSNLGLVIRVQHGRETRQASPEDLPFPYDHPPLPFNEFGCSIEGNRLHLQLTSEDQIAFVGTAKAGKRWGAQFYIVPLLTEFAVKRLYEIYKSDPESFAHLAWVQEHQFSEDLGL